MSLSAKGRAAYPRSWGFCTPYCEWVLNRDVVASVERVCVQPLTAKSMREQVLAVLRRAMSWHAHAFMLTDPTTRVATSPLADVPQLAWTALPSLSRWRYLTTVNRWRELDDQGIAAASLLEVTGGDLSRSALWTHVQRDMGVVDTAMTVFADRYGCWGFLDLWRTAEPFSRSEIDLLAAIAPAVTQGLRAALTRTFVDRSEQLVPIRPAVVVLGPDLAVRSQTAAAAETLLRLNPPDEPMAPIPAAAYNIAAALIADEQGVPVGAPWSRVHLGASRWVTVKADRIVANADRRAGHTEVDALDIAVAIEPSTPAERMDLFARSHGLSGREAEVLQLVGTGLDSKEIAAQLVLSEHTVNDHVKAVLAKTRARTRQVLLSRALGAA